MEQIYDRNAVPLQQKDAVPLQNRLVLEALQVIKERNKNASVTARQAIIMLESRLLTFIKDIYGDDPKYSYEQLTKKGFTNKSGKHITGMAEQYIVDYEACFHSKENNSQPPAISDMAFIHQSVLQHSNSYSLIYDSLSALTRDKRQIVTAERGRGRGKALEYQITLTGSQVLKQITDRIVPTKYPGKYRNKNPAISPIPSPIPANVSPDTMKLIAAADVEMANRRLFDALYLYDQAIECSKKETNSLIPELYYNKGVCLYSTGEIDKAIICYQSVVYLNPNFMEAYYALGVLLTIRGQLTDALGYLNKAHEMASQDILVLAQLLLVLYRLDRNDEAKSLLLGSEPIIINESKKVLSTPIPVSQGYDVPAYMPPHVPAGREADFSKVPNRLKMNQMEDYKKKSGFGRMSGGHGKSARGSDRIYSCIPAELSSLASDPQQVNEARKILVLQGKKDSVESIAGLSYNIGIGLIENGDYEQARKFLTITRSIMPDDSLTNYILNDIENRQTIA